MLKKIPERNVREEIKKEIEQIQLSFPYNIDLLIISPPRELPDILDFSPKSIRRSMNLGRRVAQERSKEIKEFFL